MTQNRSSAVMANRIEPHDSLEDFPTPPWATRALVERVLWPRGDLFGGRAILWTQRAWEPCCNRGYMARPMAEYFSTVSATDIFDYGWAGQERVCDFLFPASEPPAIAAHGVDWIFMNPPFRLGLQFVERALALRPRCGVAVFVRAGFLEGGGRYARLYGVRPPSLVAHFAERVFLFKGIVRDPEKKYRDPKSGEMKRPSSATAYCWLVWANGVAPQPTIWIPPCRKELERPGDYEDHQTEQQ